MNTHHTTLVKTLATLALFATATLTGAAASLMTGGKHDLKAYVNAGGEICIACHTPHNAQVTQLIPL